jgi:predicted deacetylase
MRSRYLLRFDDICPTMNWDVWRQVEAILLAFDVKPILAVVPDNQDEVLKVAEANPGFWDEVRAWQARGWTIGLHGYQHRYVTRDAGLMGIKASSEFSGLPREEQYSKLRSAIDIFEREHVVPDIWVAPAHSFDRTTLEVLSALRIRCLSDGFSLFPYLDSHGMMWIPQQLWRFRKFPLGLWTVCMHLNRWGQEDLERFRSDVRRCAADFGDFEMVMAAYQNRKPSMTDAFWSGGYQIAMKGKRWLRHLGSNGAGATW